MKQLTIWQGIGLLTIALNVGLIGRFWLEGMVFTLFTYFGAFALILVSITLAKQPKSSWILVFALIISLFSWVGNFTIGVVF